MTVMIHEFQGKSVQKKIDQDNFLLTNNQGGFISLSQTLISKHQGVVFFSGLDHFKTINNIRINKKLTVLKNRFTHIERYYEDDIREKIIYPSGYNALILEFNKEEEVEINFDCRKIWDLRNFGRSYNIYEEKDRLIVEFTKTEDFSEDGSDKEEFKVFEVLHLISVVADLSFFRKKAPIY